MVKPFVVQVEGDMPAGDEEEMDSPRPAWAVPLGVTLIAAIVGAIAFYVYKKRKNPATWTTRI